MFNGGTVCDDGFDANAAVAICREMGFTGATDYFSGQFVHEEDGYDAYNRYISLSINLDDVSCRGNDWNEDCSFNLNHNCGHSEDVQLICEGMDIEIGDVFHSFHFLSTFTKN